MPPEVLQRFGDLLERARGTSLKEPTAVTLATADRTGQPAARVVLLRGFDERGFVFYTNTLSAKGRDLQENPRAAMCFHWGELTEQVRVRGGVERVADDEADAYWAGRARASQMGAWASQQSGVLSSREELLKRVEAFETRFADKEVPRPEHWTGFRLVPERIEFWSARPARLHQRTVYERQDAGWKQFLLYP
jgi:pyridoxamine 5'-phosphate oxidase